MYVYDILRGISKLPYKILLQIPDTYLMRTKDLYIVFIYSKIEVL